MLPDFSDYTALFQTVEKEQLYEWLISQLKKDFALANVDIALTIEMEPAKLRTELHEKIYYLILEKFTAYLNLLYVIDVPEKSLQDIHMADAVEVAEQITFLVLKRELQKVWLKVKYS